MAATKAKKETCFYYCDGCKCLMLVPKCEWVGPDGDKQGHGPTVAIADGEVRFALSPHGPIRQHVEADTSPPGITALTPDTQTSAHR